MVTPNPDKKFTLEDLDTFVTELNEDNTERLLRERQRTPARLGDGALKNDLARAIQTGRGRGSDLEDQNIQNR